MRLRSFVRSVLLAGAVSVLVAEDARAVLSFPESAQVTADWDTFGGNVDEYIPRLAIGPDDRATVAWRQEVSANAAIYVRRVAVDGTMEAQRRATPNGEVGADAQVVTGSDGVSTVVWVNGDGVNDDAIMARRLLPDDSWEGPGFELSDSANAAGDPNIAIDSQGRVVVAWERDNDIEAARISAAGTPGSVIELAADADQYYRPEVTMDHADRALVTYDRFDGAFMSSILARRINANGSLEPQRSIYIADSDSQATNPDVAFTSGDVAVIAFATEDTNTFEKTVQSRTLNEIGGLGAIQTLGAPGGSATDPTTLMDSQDRARVVWSAGPPSLSTEEVTQVRRLDVNAQPTGAAPLEIANGAHAQAVIDSRDRISVAYELEPDHESVQVRRISADGVPGPAKTVAGLDPTTT